MTVIVACTEPTHSEKMTRIFQDLKPEYRSDFAIEMKVKDIVHKEWMHVITVHGFAGDNNWKTCEELVTYLNSVDSSHSIYRCKQLN